MDLLTGTPFWPLRDGLIGSYPALREKITADVAIVGAGITGALAAYELTKAGAKVVVVDRRDVASGSSAATTGLLLYDTDASLEELTSRVGKDNAPRAYRLGVEAIEYLGRLTQGLDDPCGFSARPRPGMRFGIAGRQVIDSAVVLHRGVYHLFSPDNGRVGPPRGGNRHTILRDPDASDRVRRPERAR